MAQPTVAQDTTVRITRTFAAPRERVFQAWTDPEKLKAWWGPPGYATPVAEVELRVAGRYRLGMRKMPDGEIFYLSGTYREVRPPERLVYTWRWEGEPGGGETQVTVEFRDRGGSTEVVLVHDMFPSRDERDKHEMGWSGAFEKLATFLAAR
jgi:uncharacterized protein YndB with AHSA1/START domain